MATSAWYNRWDQASPEIIRQEIERLDALYRMPGTTRFRGQIREKLEYLEQLVQTCVGVK